MSARPGDGCDDPRQIHPHWCGSCGAELLFSRAQCRQLLLVPPCPRCGELQWWKRGRRVDRPRLPRAAPATSIEALVAGPAPRREDFVLLADYEHAWCLWRALRRDAQLTNAELDAQFRVLAERLGYPGVGLWDEP